MAVTPSGRVVLFGATGYTGRLTLDALVASGVEPLLVGRDPVRLGGLSDSTGLVHRIADVHDPVSVEAVLEPGDVLLTTVGPFARFGTTALEACVKVGAHYVDSTGEGPFIRTVFDDYGPRARTAGVRLLTAFGYDFVPGNLAGALALQRAAERTAPRRPPEAGTASRVDVGYFLTGSARGAMSGGTRASAAGVLTGRGYTYSKGRIASSRPLSQVLRFEAGGEQRSALSVSASEQFGLPRIEPGLREVRVGLGWFGTATTPLSLVSRALGVAEVVPGVRAAASAATRRFGGPGSTGGPDAGQRAGTGSLVVADVRDAAGTVIAHVELVGPNGYDLTAGLLAWAAASLATGDLHGQVDAGALTPVEAFGLDALTAACADLGLVERT